jgi:hypothetical protein
LQEFKNGESRSTCHSLGRSNVSLLQRSTTPSPLPFGDQDDDEFEDDSKFPGNQPLSNLSSIICHFAFIAGDLTHVDC